MPHLARVEMEGVEIAEESWFLGASVAAGVEVEWMLYDGVSGAAVGRGPEGRNAVVDEATQGKGPRRLEAAGLKCDGLVAEGTQVDCSLEEAAGEVVWERGRHTEPGEKLPPGCPTSLPSVCTCTVSNKTVPITNPNTVREAHCNHTWECRLVLV